MNIWILSDRHHKHTNIIKYENRPVDFDDIIIKNWCKVVQPEDLVIDLGDVIFGAEKKKNLRSILAALPGKKILCRGNHDSYPDANWGDWDWFMECGFDAVVDYFVYKDLAFSHAPLTPLPKQTLHNYGKDVRLNLHGHFHRGRHRSPKDNPNYKDEFYNYQYWLNNQDKYKLIQIEDELRPFSLEEVLSAKTK